MNEETIRVVVGLVAFFFGLSIGLGLKDYHIHLLKEVIKSQDNLIKKARHVIKCSRCQRTVFADGEGNGVCNECGTLRITS